MSPRAGGSVPFGDRALLVDTTDVAGAHALAAVLGARKETGGAPGVIDEVVVGFASVLVVLDPDPDRADSARCAAWVDAAVAGGGASGAGHRGRPLRTHLLPVVFDGADLDDVAATVGLPTGRVVELVVAAELEVAFVGFAPGFPYLVGLPPELAGLPRRSTPRASVPAGSVAVAAGFASVYPRSTPGGWHLLGRTTETLFDPDAPPHGRIAPGDRVRFTVADGAPPPATATEAGRPLLDAGGAPRLDLLEPGLATTVQDGGRRGCAHLGVPAAGAADPRSLALVNLLLGNAPDAAALECTATGPTFRVVGDGLLAVVGSTPGAVDVTVDGHPVADGAVLPVTDGQVVRVGRVRHGLRAYVGAAGGLATPVLFGSRSSDTLSGLGPGLLRAGDRLALGTPGRARGLLTPPIGPSPGPTVLHVVVGPHPSPGDGGRSPVAMALTDTVWRVASQVDRIGVRLESADGSRLDGGGPRASTPMVTGAVQVPPDGRPIVLLPDHGTVGGYPVVACVATADLPRLGQLAPGDEVAFAVVDLATATDMLRRERGQLASRVSGWFPTAAGT